MLLYTLTTSYLKNGTWKEFKFKTSNEMDGIKIQTPSNCPFYLQYRTCNKGNTSFYSFVKSNENDYAGANGKPIQQLQIQAYTKAGTKLTSRIVVMYRASVEGRWLPWVSNADPEWMQSVHTKYHLDGTIDTSSWYAGNKGENIDGLEIRVYDEDSVTDGDFTGGEAAPDLSYMVDSLDNWESFPNATLAPQIDGIKIQTSPSDSFYLTYKSWNAGRNSYYPEVKSTENDYNDYAGYPGQKMQLLSIQAYDNNGNRLRSGVVVMYRVSVNDRWLPWVSNADPEWMRSVQRQYNLDGTLDTVSTYAGNAGQNINGVEIRVFKGTTNDHPLGDLPGAEASLSLSYMRDNLDNWKSFTHRVETSPIEGIKIQTSTSKGYYLMYKTKNAGLSSYLPLVKSTGTAYNDYAGLPGKPIQLLHIQAYKNDGTRLRSGVVVMYRVRVSGRWLPWVSNADPEWMVSVQSKYDLGGTLDTKSTYAGNAGQNIDGVEIRVFEENDTNGKPHTPTGDYKIIDVPFISQYPKYPTGCESVSTVMALRHIGNQMTVDTFIDKYLNKGSTKGFNPYVEFGGNPKSTSGWGCFAEAIQLALNKFLPDTNYTSKVLRGVSVADLCSEYIDKNIPVIFFATQQMRAISKTTTWYADGRKITWKSPFHCLLLVGYDDNNYIFNDPQDSKALTYYNKEAVETAYAAEGEQAVVIVKKDNPKPEPEKVNSFFDMKNYQALKTELTEYVDSHLDIFHSIVSWHSSEEALDTVLQYDTYLTNCCNELNIQKELVQTVFFREQRFVWLQDNIADTTVIDSYNYDDAFETWMNLSPAEQLIVPMPEKPLLYSHDCSTGLCQIFAATAIKSINYAVINDIISENRIYDADNLDDLKEIWFKLKDEPEFNIKCAILTLIYEALSTLKYDDNFTEYSYDQIAMLFTKYNSISNEPNDYGKECTEWYKILRKYR